MENKPVIVVGMISRNTKRLVLAQFASMWKQMTSPLLLATITCATRIDEYSHPASVIITNLLNSDVKNFGNGRTLVKKISKLVSIRFVPSAKNPYSARYMTRRHWSRWPYTFPKCTSGWSSLNGNHEDSALEKQVTLQRLVNEAQRFREECSEKVRTDIEDYFDSFISNVEIISQAEHVDNIKSSLNSAHRKKEKGDLPDKEFVTRNSVLTLGLDFGLIQWGLGKSPKVVSCWLWMQCATLVVVYPGFYCWSYYRTEGKPGIFDYLGLLVYMLYQGAFLILPVWFIIEQEMPPASAVIIATEQTARIMNRVTCALVSPSTCTSCLPPHSTANIRWSYVVSNFGQVLACLLYTYYIFERFCVPVFHNFNQDHVSARLFLTSMFNCMLPGTLVLLIGFFAILHSWLNAFAEMLRFADRMFYKLFGPKQRGLSMASVFLLSAVFHEYVLIMALGFFYPVLFVMFMGAGCKYTTFFLFQNGDFLSQFFVGFIFVKGTSRSWNVFLWLALLMGMGILLCLYTIEWYARQNCKQFSDDFLDILIPRSWTCNGLNGSAS
ncbi:SOAT1-like protein [Mya arenaria]|uniref:SOAT1-like protein n=1 Tax=Mya arenaria TaxID=6604 RepID=A0ABY7DDE4_MYAAR|nr:SOAT1-like protein [Mya arenaria]